MQGSLQGEAGWVARWRQGGWGMPAPPREKFRGLEILIRWQRALQQHPEGCLRPRSRLSSPSRSPGDTSLPGKLNQFAPSMPAPDLTCVVTFPPSLFVTRWNGSERCTELGFHWQVCKMDVELRKFIHSSFH